MTPVAERERSTVEPVAAGEAIGGFIDGIVRKKNGHIPGARLQRLAARLVPANSRTAIRRLVTDAASPLQRRKAAGLVEGAARLHLGSGELPRDGWVNVDLAGAPVDLVWNLNRRLPFPDRSIDAVFHEHLLEHLTMDRALALTRECHRVLKPGGVLRIAVPDARRHVEWYCRDTLPPERAGHATPLMSVLQQFYGHGHRAMYDFETLALLCHAAGFGEVERRGFGESRLAPCPDHEWREWDSLYVEMVR